MRFAIWKNQGGQYWFRVVAANGQTLAHSEMYTTKQSAENAIGVIKREAAIAAVVDMTDHGPAERPR